MTSRGTSRTPKEPEQQGQNPQEEEAREKPQEVPQEEPQQGLIEQDSFEASQAILMLIGGRSILCPRPCPRKPARN